MRIVPAYGKLTAHRRSVNITNFFGFFSFIYLHFSIFLHFLFRLIIKVGNCAENGWACWSTTCELDAKEPGNTNCDESVTLLLRARCSDPVPAVPPTIPASGTEIFGSLQRSGPRSRSQDLLRLKIPMFFLSIIFLIIVDFYGEKKTKKKYHHWPLYKDPLLNGSGCSLTCLDARMNASAARVTASSAAIPASGMAHLIAQAPG